MKHFLLAVTTILVSSAINAAIFLLAYKKLAFPFIHEEQRLDNAPYIFTYVIPSFILAATLMVILINLTHRFKR